ncbi:MAG: DUF945 family protein [Desulfuromusa sp.]|nr:DUF945 family protein [Desulfuromusa sp.]
MKKILSILMALTIVALFALTWYCSNQTEQHFTAQIAAINQASPELINVELINYHRKLFTANAETAIRIRGEEKLSLNHQIRHFVWGVKMITTLAPDSALAKEIVIQLPSDQLQLITDFSLLGASKSRFILPQLTFQNDSSSLEMTGFSIGWDLNGDLTMGNLICLLDNLQIQHADQSELNLANLRISSQMTDLQDIPLGNGELQLEKLQLMRSGKPAIEFQNIQYWGQTDLHQELFSSAAELNFAQLLLAGETLSNGRLKLTLSGIDADLIHSIQQTAGQLQQQTLNQQSSPLELQLQLFGLYSELLNSGITLTLEELSLSTDNGKVSGDGVLSLLKESTAESPLFSLESITANFQLEIDRDAFVTGYRLLNNLQSAEDKYQNPAVLAEQAEQIAGGLVQKGIFTRQDGDKFRIDFSWAEGQGGFGSAQPPNNPETETEPLSTKTDP